MRLAYESMARRMSNDDYSSSTCGETERRERENLFLAFSALRGVSLGKSLLENPASQILSEEFGITKINYLCSFSSYLLRFVCGI